MPIDAKALQNPKVLAVGAAGIFAVWYFFFHHSSPAASTSPLTGSSPVDATPSPHYTPGSSGEQGSGGADAAPSGSDLLGSIGNLVDSILGQESLFSNFAMYTQGQVFDFARASNDQFAGIAINAQGNLTSLAQSALSNPPVQTTIYNYTAPAAATPGPDPGTGYVPPPAPAAPVTAPYSPSYASPTAYSSGSSTVTLPNPVVAPGTGGNSGFTAKLTPAQQAVRTSSGRGPQF